MGALVEEAEREPLEAESELGSLDNVYLSPNAKAEEPKAYNVVKTLFDHYLAHPEDLPVDERPGDPGYGKGRTLEELYG